MSKEKFKNEDLDPKTNKEQAYIGGEAPEKDDEECDA